MADSLLEALYVARASIRVLEFCHISKPLFIWPVGMKWPVQCIVGGILGGYGV